MGPGEKSVKNPEATRAEQDQLMKFIDAARKVGADEDPDAFKERLKHLVKAPATKAGAKRQKASGQGNESGD